MAHGTVGLEAAIHLGEINGSLALMNLHRIPTAEGDMGAPFAGQMNEVMLAAGTATWPGLSGGNLGVFVGPEVKRK